MLVYEKLDGWKVCHELVLATYRATDEAIARDEDAIILRLRRCALRAVGRIAFGAGSGNRRMMYRAVMQALSWLSEFAYLLELAKARGLLAETSCTSLDALRGRGAFYTTRLLEP